MKSYSAKNMPLDFILEIGDFIAFRDHPTCKILSRPWSMCSSGDFARKETLVVPD